MLFASVDAIQLEALPLEGGASKRAMQVSAGTTLHFREVVLLGAGLAGKGDESSSMVRQLPRLRSACASSGTRSQVAARAMSCGRVKGQVRSMPGLDAGPGLAACCVCATPPSFVGVGYGVIRQQDGSSHVDAALACHHQPPPPLPATIPRRSLGTHLHSAPDAALLRRCEVDLLAGCDAGQQGRVLRAALLA